MFPNAPTSDYPPEIIGYAEPWIVAPGETVGIKVSCTEPEYSYRTVRLVQGVELDHSPKKVDEEVREIPRGCCKGKFQLANPGSYAWVDTWDGSKAGNGIHASFYMQPWMPVCDHRQVLISTLESSTQAGFEVTICEDGEIEIRVGTGDQVESCMTGMKAQKRVWYKFDLTVQCQVVKASMTSTNFQVEPLPPARTYKTQLSSVAVLSKSGPLLIAAGSAKCNRTSGILHTEKFFNGRIDELILGTAGEGSSTLARFDFSLNMSSDEILDISGNGHHGVLVNAPTRAVRGHDWDGREPDWTKATYGYGAIHFHDDDLEDAKWETDFTITIPLTARSGAYAVEVEAVNGKDRDWVTFFVRPTSSKADNNGKVCLVFSTFTYLAYANERLHDPTRRDVAKISPGFDIDKCIKSSEFAKMERRHDLGLSTYDPHNDGSGVVFSSSKRPILNVRPGYVMWAFSRPREFSADLMMLGFLEREKIPYEILTDHDLHLRGVSALEGFNTVITGCHPEYPTLESFNAYRAYSRSGGNLMYLGGNGFYWVSALDSARPHRLEVRRGDVGVRPYTLPGGERIHSLNGQQGSLWRSRGMSCNTLFGVGFCGQGTGLGVPFRRTDTSRDTKFGWMFQGIESDTFGINGLGGGASGDEIDRFDIENGSPSAAIVLARSTGHSDDFGIAVEDVGFPALNTLGTQTDLIRSDIVYYIGTGGGSVFSVGSINWYCSLAWDGYDNDVAMLTGNVIRGFLSGKR